MRLGGRRPGSLTVFVDSASEEALLEVGAADDGTPLIGFHLYDSEGHLVSESSRQAYPEGLCVRCGDEDELLLLVPDKAEDNIQYRLYSPRGKLLATSDGIRTQIFGNLRMDGPKPAERKTR